MTRVTFYISASIAVECGMDGPGWDTDNLSSNQEWSRKGRTLMEAYQTGEYRKTGRGGTVKVRVAPDVAMWFVDQCIYYYGDPTGADPEGFPVKKRMRDLGDKIRKLVAEAQNE